MAPYKNLSVDQTAFLINNAKTLTLHELAKVMPFSKTKIYCELNKLNIEPIVKQNQRRTATGVYRPKKFIYVSGMQPNIEKPFIRPAAVYSNVRTLYPELQDQY